MTLFDLFKMKPIKLIVIIDLFIEVLDRYDEKLNIALSTISSLNSVVNFKLNFKCGYAFKNKKY